MNAVIQAFQSFSSFGHLPISELGTLHSLFPMIQSICYPPSGVIPPDLPLWESGVPIACIIGCPREKKLTIMPATVSLITLNTCQLILGYGSQNTVDSASSNYLCEVLSISSELLSSFQNELSEEQEMNIKLISRLKKAKFDPSQQHSLQSAQKLCKKMMKYIEKQFKFLLSNTGVDDVFREYLKTLLDFQTFGVFEHKIGNVDFFKECERCIIDFSSSLFLNDKDDCLENLEIMISSIKIQASRIGIQNFIGGIRKHVYQEVVESINSLYSKLKSINLEFKCAKFIIEEEEYVSFEYSQSITGILRSFASNQPNQSLVSQLANTLYTQTNSITLQFLCSAASYYPYLSSGYTSLIASYLPIENSQRLNHLESVLPIFGSIYSQFCAKSIHYITNNKIEIPQSISLLKEWIFISPSSLSNCWKNLVAFSALQGSSHDSLKGSDDFLIPYSNMGRIYSAWLISTAIALRTSSMNLIESCIKLFERHVSISTKTFSSLHESYSVISRLQNNISSYSSYQPLLEAVSVALDVASHIIRQVINLSPVSIAEIEIIPQLLGSVKSVENHYKSLYDAIQPLISLPNSCSLVLAIQSIEPMLQHVESIIDTLQKQPDYIHSSRVSLQLIGLLYEQTMLSLPQMSFTDLLISSVKSLQATILSEDLITHSDVFAQELRDILDKLRMQNQIPKKFQDINIKDRNRISKLFDYFQMPIIKASTISLLQNSQDESDPDMEELLQKLILIRLHGVEKINFSKINGMSDDELMQNVLYIAAALPLTAQASILDEIDCYTIRLLKAKNATDVRSIIQNIIKLIAIIAPLRTEILMLQDVLVKPGTETLQQITGVLEKYEFEIIRSSEFSKRIRSMIDLTSISAFLKHITTDGLTEQYLVHVCEFLKSSSDGIYANTQVSSLLSLFMSTSTLYGSFSDDHLVFCQNICSSLEDYVSNPSKSSLRSLMGNICQLPYEFQTEGTMTIEWTLCLLNYITKDLSLKLDLTPLYNALQLEASSASINQYAQVDVTSQIDSLNDIDDYRLDEMSRHTERLLKKLVKAAVQYEAPIVLSRFEEFYRTAYDLRMYLLSSSNGKAIALCNNVDSVLTNVTSIVSDIISSDRNTVSNLSVELSKIHQVQSELVSNSDISYIIREIKLLCLDIEEVFRKIENDPSDDKVSQADPFKKLLIQKSKIVLKNSIPYMQYNYEQAIVLYSNLNDQNKEKSIIRSLNDFRESIQMMYLLIRMFHIEDNGLLEKSVFTCRRYSSAIDNMSIHFLTRDMNTDNVIHIKEYSDIIQSHLKDIMNFALQFAAPGTQSNPLDDLGELSEAISLERLRLEAEIIKRRKALHDAEEYSRLLSK